MGFMLITHQPMTQAYDMFVVVLFRMAIISRGWPNFLLCSLAYKTQVHFREWVQGSNDWITAYTVDLYSQWLILFRYLKNICLRYLAVIMCTFMK